MSSEDWYDVCFLSQLRAECGVAAVLADGPVAIFNVGDPGQIFAVGHIDPRTQTPTIARGLVGSADGEPIVVSPLLKDRFSLVTGECLNADLPPLATYEVSVEQERVHVRSNVIAQKQP